MSNQGPPGKPGPSPEVTEPGSFRDRTGSVFYRDGAVFRGLSDRGLENWRALSGTSFFARAVAEGKVVETEETPSGSEPWAGVLHHRRIRYVSYPYEWPFGMLRDAALLQLDLLRAALDEGLILKDASPFNIQWEGTRPIFIDVPSFEPIREGEPWAGYRQFCQLFLYPLFLQAYRDVPFQPWLRGQIDGIEPEQIVNILSLRDMLRPGVFTHAWLQSRLQKQFSAEREDMRQSFRDAGFQAELVRTNAARLRKLIGRLEWRRATSEWSGYADATSYGDHDVERKEEFVRAAVGSRPWTLVWDLGCNVGRFSRIAAAGAETVVAMDGDAVVIERLYQSLLREENRKILPLVVRLSDPSPSLGWGGVERRSLPDRGRPDLVLCLALVHHLAIGSNIPLRGLVEWLADLGGALVIEFVTRDDEMVQRLLHNKEDQYGDYDRAVFERLLEERFDVVQRQTLKEGKRILYFGSPRANT